MIPFICVVLVAAFARFYDLSGHGLSVCDSFIYSTEAHRWYFDHIFVNNWSKPGYHLLSYLAVALWGFYDFTLLYLNAFLDLVSIIFLILIGLKIKMRWLFVFSAALIYAFLPFILQESTIGLPHLPAMAFLMASFYVFLVYFHSDRKPLWLIFLAGALIDFAGQVHPTLFCSSIFYVIVLMAMSVKNWRILPGLLFFCLGGLSVFVGLALIMSYKDRGLLATLKTMINAILYHRQIGLDGHQGNLLSQTGYILSGLASILTIPFVIFLLASIAVFIFLKLNPGLKKKDAARQEAGISSINLVLLYGCVANFLILSLMTILAWQNRFLVPIIPLTILSMFALIDRLTFKFPEEWQIGQKTLLVVLAIAICNISWNWKSIEKKPPTIFRQMANVLENKVDGEHRLLISPSFFFTPAYYLEEAYFDGFNLYRVKGPWKPDLGLLQAYHIKYVAIAKDLNTDVYVPNSFFSSDLQKKKEYFLMYLGLNDIGAKCIYDSPKVSIYEIPVHDSLGSPHVPPNDLPFFNVQNGPNGVHPPDLYVVGIK